MLKYMPNAFQKCWIGFEVNIVRLCAKGLETCSIDTSLDFSYTTIDVIGIRRVLSSMVLSVITVPVSASLRKISTVVCKSKPSRRKVS